MAKYLLTACASLFIGLMPGFASAEVKCGERAKIVKRLGTAYQEVGQAGGLISQVRLLEVFVSPATRLSSGGCSGHQDLCFAQIRAVSPGELHQGDGD